MEFTVNSFVADVRAVTGDTDANDYRHTDAAVRLFVVDGLRRLFAVRPDSRYANGVIEDYDFPSTDAELSPFTIDIEPRWRMGVVYHAAARCFETDVVDAVNRELAAGYFKRADEVFAA